MEKDKEYLERRMDFKKIRLLYLRKIRTILLLTLLGAVLTAGIYLVVREVHDKGQFYRVSSDYYITFNLEEFPNGVDHYNAYTWDSILRDDPIVDEVVNRLPADYTKDEVKASVTGEMISDYRILTVHVTHKDPVRTEEIAYAYTRSLETFANQIDMLSTIELWSREECLPVVEKNLVGNAAVLGAVLGFVFALFAVAFACLLDDSIYLERDFTQRFTVPFLGMMTKKGSESCKQELIENLSYLLKKDQRYYCALVTTGQKANHANKPSSANSSGNPNGDWVEELKTLCPQIAGAVSLQGDDLDTLRQSDGAVLLIPWGIPNGALVDKTIQFLSKQDCKITGAVLYDAEDAFLKTYYKS